MRPSVSRAMTVPPAAAWDVLTHVDTWGEWGPTVSGATLPGGVVVADARGTVHTAVGLSLPFVVTRFAEGRSWAWSVAGVPATSHHVRPTIDGCVVTFDVPWWAPAYLAVCALALPRIERLAADRTAAS